MSTLRFLSRKTSQYIRYPFNCFIFRVLFSHFPSVWQKWEQICPYWVATFSSLQFKTCYQMINLPSKMLFYIIFCCCCNPSSAFKWNLQKPTACQPVILKQKAFGFYSERDCLFLSQNFMKWVLRVCLMQCALYI